MSKHDFFKWFKRGVLVLAITPILIFLGFAGAVSLIDFNQYKPQIEQEVSQLVGREFKIKGDIALSIIPLVFHAEDLVLQNSIKFTEKNLLMIKEIQLEISLKKLFLDQEISIISLELIEPEVKLIERATDNNWSDLTWLADLVKINPTINKLQATPKVPERFNHLQLVKVSHVDVEEVVVSKSTDAIFDWYFQSLVIEAGEIKLQNLVRGHEVSLSNINLFTYDVKKNQPFNITSSFIYHTSFSPRTYDFQLNSTLEITNQFRLWTLSNWRGIFKLQISDIENIPAIHLMTKGKHFQLNLLNGYVNVAKGQLRGLKADLITDFSGNLGTNRLLKGVVDVKGLNFKYWGYYLGLPLPRFPNKQILTEGNGQFEWAWDGKELQLKQMSTVD